MVVKVVTDSTCDLPVDIIKQYDISVVPIYVNLGEKSFQDGVDLDRNTFYSNLQTLKTYPSTSSPSVDSFVETFTKLTEKGADSILSIHISSTISGVFNIAVLASRSIKHTLVQTFDAGQISFGTGFIVATAAKMAQAGKSLNEILASIQDLANRSYTFAIVDNLNYLRHSGRISHLKSLVGSILQVKPVLRFYKGKPSVEIARTSKSAVQRLVNSVKSLGKLEKINVLHINAYEKAKQLLNNAVEFIPELSSANIIEVNPAIATHIGPGAVGLAAVVASRH